MIRIVGIDEAGYGPSLGPLLIGASVWDLADEHADADLWSLLGAAVTRDAARRDWRLRIGDSKEVFDRKHGLAPLERVVLTLAQAADLNCDGLGAFLAALGATVAPTPTTPWYADLAQPLPLDASFGSTAGVRARLLAAMNAAEARLATLRACVLTEDALNARLAHTHNKAAVLVERILRLIDWVDTHTPASFRRIHFRVDRLGGRSHYTPLLLSSFPDRALRVEAESETTSRYRLSRGDRQWTIEFSVDADRRHLPVALASMLAKYLRESLMDRFNAYWRRWVPALRPTAGYYTDAQRFLKDIRPALPQSGLKPDAFVRAR